VFRDRRDAGRRLAGLLVDYARVPGLLVLGLPRGGVVVAAEVARALHGELDVLVVRKLGLPGRPELAIGAVATGGVTVLNDDVLSLYGVSPDQLNAVATRELAELDRRLSAYRSGPQPLVAGRTAIVVDDGLATGSTMRAACQALLKQSPARLVVAVPVAPAGTAGALAGAADDVVVVHTPAHFRSVGDWYDDFAQTEDDEVCQLLAERPDSSLS
jgi:predicted phosphoribosyltransferase